MRNQKGFTLIELVVVMVIAAILFTVLGVAIFVGVLAYKHVTANDKAPVAISTEK